MRYLIILLAVVACNSQDLTQNSSRSLPGAASRSASAGVEHSVTGTGTQSIAPGYEYATTVAVHSDASGRVWGTAVTRLIDLSAFGIPGSGELEMKPECMRVVGTTAYISLIVTKVSDPTFGNVGDRGIFWVRDGAAGEAAQVGHAGPAMFFDPAGMICTTTPPPLPANAVTKGRFNVR